MLVTTTYENLIKNLRLELITQSQLSSDRVLDALSVRSAGIDLAKIIGNDSTISFNLDDSFILFELIENEDATNFMTEESENDLSTYVSFKFKLHIYGNHCHSDIQKIIARMRTPESILSLRDKGIYVQGFDFPEAINEYINNTLWPRCDTGINIQARFSYNKVAPTDHFTNATDVNVIINEF